jgi:hypothetical protein
MFPLAKVASTKGDKVRMRLTGLSRGNLLVLESKLIVAIGAEKTCDVSGGGLTMLENL